MMCQRMGRPPISTIGFGRNSVSSRKRVPSPPHSKTTFTGILRRVWVRIHFIHPRRMRQEGLKAGISLLMAGSWNIRECDAIIPSALGGGAPEATTIQVVRIHFVAVTVDQCPRSVTLNTLHNAENRCGHY